MPPSETSLKERILAAAARTQDTTEDWVAIDYTNWRGERGWRIIRPEERGVTFTSSEYHPNDEWLLNAYDMEKLVWRNFALKEIHAWRPVSALLSQDQSDAST